MPLNIYVYFNKNDLYCSINTNHKMGASNSKTSCNTTKPTSICNRCFNNFCDKCMYIKTCFKSGVCKKCLSQCLEDMKSQESNKNYE